MSMLHVLIVTIGLLMPLITQAQPLPVQSKGAQGIKETIDKDKLLRASCSAAEIIEDAMQWIKQSPLNLVDMQGSRLHSPVWIEYFTGQFDHATDSQLLMSHQARELFSDRLVPKSEVGVSQGSAGGMRQPFDINNTDQRTFVLTVTGRNATLNFAGSTPKAMCSGDYIYTMETDEFVVLKLTKAQRPK
jgi:hypothetical protein